LTPLTLPNGQQLELYDFPEAAVREALINAVVHRDYTQRGPVVVDHSPQVLGITSPGPLVAGVTPENILTHPSAPRNRTLAGAMRTLGFAEEIGRGIDRIFREMIRSGRALPRFEAAPDHVRVTLVGGAPNTHVARFVAALSEDERDDTDTMLILFRLCAQRTVDAEGLAPFLQKTVDEAESTLRRLASDGVQLLEPTRQTVRRARPSYRLRSDPLKALGPAVAYQRRSVDETDRKIIAHVREYGKVTNKTVQNLFDVGIPRARDILRDLVEREILIKEPGQERGPGVAYVKGSRFPTTTKRRGGAPENLSLPLGRPRPRRRSK
jgi:ATP-dependent DNA helicase RecG